MLFTVYLWTKVPRKRVLGTLRVIGYGLVVSVGLGALTVRTAIANVHEESLTLGRKLADLGDLLQTTNELRLNGQTIYFASASTDESVKTVLDRYEAHCNKSQAFRPLDWKTLAEEGDGPAPSQTKLDELGLGGRLGVMRSEDPGKQDGTVFCFTSDRGPTDLFNALRKFGETNDVHDLGDLRYVHAESRAVVDPKTKRSRIRTTVQTMWTDGSFNLKSITGSDTQDSPGSDFATLPRPLDSIRRFTAEAVGTPYSARVYESKAPGNRVLSDYTSRMSRDGWAAIQSPVAEYPKGQDGRWYTRFATGEQVAVSVDGSSPGHTMVVVASLGVMDKSPVHSNATPVIP